ncbi:MAG TPA: thiamine pyrophosphate-dependent enzyme, partial [Telluria sp.]
CATFTQLVQRKHAPCTLTLMGLGAYPASSELWLGMLGMHGPLEANLVMHGADLVVCVGARFDDRVTGDLAHFCPNARIIHIDIDPCSTGKVVRADVGLVGDCGAVLAALLAKLDAAPIDHGLTADWWRQIGKVVVCVSGDASILVNIQELATAVQHKCPVKVILSDNGCMGMVRQWQELHHDGRYSHSYSEAMPGFVALARAFGWNARRVEHAGDLEAALQECLSSETPYFLDVVVEQAENCFPMIPSGRGHHEIMLAKDRWYRPASPCGEDRSPALAKSDPCVAGLLAPPAHDHRIAVDKVGAAVAVGKA